MNIDYNNQTEFSLFLSHNICKYRYLILLGKYFHNRIEFGHLLFNRRRLCVESTAAHDKSQLATDMYRLTVTTSLLFTSHINIPLKLSPQDLVHTL